MNDKHWWVSTMHVDRLCPVCPDNRAVVSDGCPHSVADIERIMDGPTDAVLIDPSCATLNCNINRGSNNVHH